MTFRRAAVLAISILTFLPALASAQLRVVTAGPVGELRTLEEANEVRIAFSEPMTPAGKLAEGRPAWFRIEPAIEGTFRWSGSRILIFTPDPKALRYATPFTVTITTAAASTNGSRLEEPYVFSFTTPTLRLMATRWYEKTNGAIVFGLTFNQPIEREKLLPFVRLRLEPHDPDFGPIEPPPDGTAEMRAQFQAKKAKVEQAAKSSRNILGFVPETWDRDRIPDTDEVLVIETQPKLPSGAWARISIDPTAPSAHGPATPGFEQQFVAMLGPGFFVSRATCVKGCNPDWRHRIQFTEDFDLPALAKAITVVDVTNPAAPQPLTPGKRADEEGEWWGSREIALEDLGFDPLPAHTYRVTIDPSLTSDTGEALGYGWRADIEYWHRTAYSSFGEGHGVWEAEGGALVPFWARNLRTVRQWLAPLPKEKIVPAIIEAEAASFRARPKGAAVVRQLRPEADKLQSYGLDATSVLSPQLRGVFQATLEEGDAIARSQRLGEDGGKVTPKSTIVQATDLGVTLKHSPTGALVWVTRLSDGSPVAGAAVEIRNRANAVVWSGTTGSDGIARAASLSVRREWWQTELVAIAEKDGDLGYAANNWSEGILPWDFGIGFDPYSAEQQMRGSFFTDRGVYRAGEEVKAKLILRRDTPEGIELYPEGTDVFVEVRNPRSDVVASTTLELSQWSSAEWSWTVPENAVYGSYSVTAFFHVDQEAVTGSFLVAAYRRPEFRVDAELAGDDAVAGTSLTGRIDARYLFGAPMGGMPVRWRLTTRPSFTWLPPQPLADLFPGRSFVWLDQCGGRSSEENVLEEEETVLGADGTLTLPFETKADAGEALVYTLEGEVTDISRQAIAGRASFTVHAAPWYIGLLRSDRFFRQGETMTTEVVAATPEGLVTAGVEVEVQLVQIQWHSARRAEGNGFYTWESRQTEETVNTWRVTTADQPVPLDIPIPAGGMYRVIATAKDGARTTRTCFYFYAGGSGYTAWERFDHNRIELIPDKPRYRPGDTAKILVKSPWETATVLVTTERETIRSQRTFQLDSTQQTVEVPITEADIPNVFASVMLVKGRTRAEIDEGGSDPGKPAFRLGYVELEVEDAAKQLKVSVKPSSKEFRPGSKASVEVTVVDAWKVAVDAEVTLWAVDYGVLSLTGYEPPNVVESVWVPQALQVITSDSRQKIIARRALTPKGAGEGGGGGAELGADATRADFRPLAFWIGSVETGSDGQATVDVTLPDSLTTYRIMAVAADRESRFGVGQDEIRTNKPLMLRPTFPRFLTPGDTATFGAIVDNQTKRDGRATVTVKSLDPSILSFTGEESQSVEVGAGRSKEVRFPARASAPGTARVEMTVRMGGESDAFRDVIPVKLATSKEVSAVYGTVPPDGRESLVIPADALPGIGGLRIELASTALVGLSEGARYLVTYPYGCAEQRASALFAMLTANELGSAFEVPELEVDKALIEKTIAELEGFQCDDGQFAFWRGECDFASPYVTAWIVHVLHAARELGFAPRPAMMERAYGALQQALSREPSTGEAWELHYSAWQAFAIRELAVGGRVVDTELNRAWETLDRAPLFAIAWLHDALVARGEAKSARAVELRRRMMNAILIEGGASHVEEVEEPILDLLWSTNTRTTAIVLRSLVGGGGDEATIRSMVRWLMEVRKKGRWGSTQENAWAMEALVAYYRKYEKEVPDFTATAAVAEKAVATATFEGRSTEATVKDVPMAELEAARAAEVPMTFSREGAGTLHYGARITWARPVNALDALDQGFTVSRSYAVEDAEKETEPSFRFAAGDLVRVTLRIRVPKERIWVAVSDPIPAGFEPVEGWFQTTASDLARVASVESHDGDRNEDPWQEWWNHGGFDHIEKKDDRVDLFATRLSEGEHVFSYLVRATTSGAFIVAPARAEEMYRPENFGRSGSAAVVVE